MKTIQISVPDMKSQHCQLRVNQALRAIEGVTIERIEPGLASISLANESLQPLVLSSIEKAGYQVAQVSSLEVESDAGKTFTFKTNINCSGCVSKVAKVLDSAEGVCHWEVDTNSSEKLLSVHSDGISEKQVMQAVQKAGFIAERIAR